ncbi:MAG: YggU family protein [Theionarchaea archaeon]|nr:YggU family protein [Theionarchaea archaeon]
MNFVSALSGDEKGTILRVHVISNAKEYLIQYDDWRRELKIKVKAQPKQGKANKDVIQFLGQYFKNPAIISGATAKSKLIKIENSLEETVTILEEIL